jgi:Na+/melibiose symporter-like transporter
MFSLPWLAPELRVYAIFGLAVFAGMAAGCGGTIAPSVQSDIIDYDEYMTGERKEGSYFAAFNFAYKSATGVMILITGYVLQFAGFVPNQVQSMEVQVSMVFLYGLFPFVCYTIGAFMFSKFTLDEETHSKMRQEMAER